MSLVFTDFANLNVNYSESFSFIGYALKFGVADWILTLLLLVVYETYFETI